MRLRSLLLLLTAAGCAGFNQTSLKHWYPPADTDTQQTCIKDRVACTNEALALIAHTAAEKQPDKAARILGTACEQGETRACETLDSRFTPPKRLKPIPNDIGHGLPHASNSYGEVACTITVQGEPLRCRGIKDGGYNPAYIEVLLRNSYTPAKLDGQPFESEYIERYVIQGDYPG